MIFRYWSLTITLVCFIFISCNNADKQSLRDEARSSLRELPPGSVPAPAATGNAISSTGSVPHYICPNNCEGSGGASAGTCPVCGSEYEHNQAYHNQPTSSQPTISPSGSSDPIVDFSNVEGESPAATAEPAQNAAGIWHYTCPNGCAGGGASAGKCASCGADLAHNTAYHSQGSSASGPSINLGNPPATTTPATPEPAQNASGVWHYTCPNGCAGGAGSAGKCSSCGGDLAHNTAYHN